MATSAYPSDLTDAEWSHLEPLLPRPHRRGRPRQDLRPILNGIMYLVKTGCQWRQLPHDFPPWGTVHWYYRRWRRDGTWAKLMARLRRAVRVAAGRDPDPSAAIIDSQSVKTTEKKGHVAATMPARK
jgi:putative transposase